MTILKTLALFWCVALALTACAGRDPMMQPVSHREDSDLSCEQLEDEANGVAATARSKINSNKSGDSADIALGVAGFFLFWPIWLAMDVKNADGMEGNNLADRVDHLRRVAVKNNCSTSGWPTIMRYN